MKHVSIYNINESLPINIYKINRETLVNYYIVLLRGMRLSLDTEILNKILFIHCKRITNNIFYNKNLSNLLKSRYIEKKFTPNCYAQVSKKIFYILFGL